MELIYGMRYCKQCENDIDTLDFCIASEMCVYCCRDYGQCEGELDEEDDE